MAWAVLLINSHKLPENYIEFQKKEKKKKSVHCYHRLSQHDHVRYLSVSRPNANEHNSVLYIPVIEFETTNARDMNIIPKTS